MNAADVLFAGVTALQSYFSEHVIACLIPAFFIAGAIAVFVSKKQVVRYFGAETRRLISYPVAAVSGAILAVCSCTILPLFTGIYRRGAGIGPATIFLFSGPAINILAIALTASVLGVDIGIARAAGAIGMSLIIGAVMATLFRHDAREQGDVFDFADVSNTRPAGISLLFFGVLVAILLIGTAALSPAVKGALIVALIAVLVVLLLRYYSAEERKNWGLATWDLSKSIVPVLIAGVFVVGVIGGIAALFVSGATPETAVGMLAAPYLGGNDLLSCFLASVIGGVLYMPTLLEVPIVGTLFGYSTGHMGAGPALSLLLAGPSVSLPNMIVIARVLGITRAAAYITLVILSATLVGFLYGYGGSL